MKIEVFDIPLEGLNIELKDTPKIDGVTITQPFKAILSLDKKGLEVLVKGIITGEVELECSRCLKDYKMQIKTLIELNYHPIEELNREELVELKRDEMDVDFYREGLIDTDDIIRDQILLNIPMKPLCSEDCKGLCPICGTDLNKFECQCEVKEIDPRMAVLQSLLRRMKKYG